MSGILDAKSRILDTILTAEGRKQLAEGGINIKYVTFTDGMTYYKATENNVAEDATLRLYLENCIMPNDQLTFLANPDGKLSGYADDARGLIRAGQIMQQITGSSLYKELRDDEFFDDAQRIIESNLNNFDELSLLSTRDFLFEEQEFGVNLNNITFEIEKNMPLKLNQHIVNPRVINEIYSDNRFTNNLNFKFLPPVNKIEDPSLDLSKIESLKPYALGNYKPWSKNNFDIISAIKELKSFAENGYVKTIKFDPTSRNNEIFIQFFEIANGFATKLDIIDFGSFYLNAQQINDLSYVLPENELPGNSVKLFFIGKVIDNHFEKSSSFVNIFTLLFG